MPGHRKTYMKTYGEKCLLWSPNLSFGFRSLTVGMRSPWSKGTQANQPGNFREDLISIKDFQELRVIEPRDRRRWVDFLLQRAPINLCWTFCPWVTLNILLHNPQTVFNLPSFTFSFSLTDTQEWASGRRPLNLHLCHCLSISTSCFKIFLQTKLLLCSDYTLRNISEGRKRKWNALGDYFLTHDSKGTITQVSTLFSMAEQKKKKICVLRFM